jgi:hypothetical protein
VLLSRIVGIRQVVSFCKSDRMIPTLPLAEL